MATLSGELAGVAILTACVILGGEVTLWMDWMGKRIHRQMIAGIENVRSRTLGGSDVAPDSSVPQAASRATQGAGGEPPTRPVEAPPVPASSKLAPSCAKAWRTENLVGAACPHTTAPTRVHIVVPAHASVDAGWQPPTAPASTGPITSVGGGSHPAPPPTGPHAN